MGVRMPPPTATPVAEDALRRPIRPCAVIRPQGVNSYRRRIGLDAEPVSGQASEGCAAARSRASLSGPGPNGPVDSTQMSLEPNLPRSRDPTGANRGRPQAPPKPYHVRRRRSNDPRPPINGPAERVTLGTSLRTLRRRRGGACDVSATACDPDFDQDPLYAVDALALRPWIHHGLAVGPVQRLLEGSRRVQPHGDPFPVALVDVQAGDEILDARVELPDQRHPFDADRLHRKSDSERPERPTDAAQRGPSRRPNDEPALIRSQNRSMTFRGAATETGGNWLGESSPLRRPSITTGNICANWLSGVVLVGKKNQ